MLGHLTAHAAKRQRLFEPLAHQRILIRVFDLRSALLTVDGALIVFSDAAKFLAAESAQRQIARWLVASVKILMPPVSRRHHHATLAPVVLFYRRTVRPDQRVPFAAENNDMGACAMAMSLLVGPHRKF